MTTRPTIPFAATTALLLVASVACAQRTVSLTLGAHNVENYFDAFEDPYTFDETADPKDRDEIAQLARVWKQLDADFIGVQEIENVGTLQRFTERYLPEAGYDYVWTNYMVFTRGIVSGFVSRVPVGPIRVWKFQRLTVPGDERTWTFARDLVSVELRPAADVTVEVFIVHLKSKRTVDKYPDDIKSAKWRLAEALQLRRILDARLEADPGALIAVIGDFNDTPESEPIQALLGKGPTGKTALVDAHAAMPDAQRITYLREPYRSTIDYIMLSPALAKHLDASAAKVINQGDVGSDHAAIAVTLKLPTRQPDAREHWPSPLKLHDIK